MSSSSSKKSVLFVCLGNICRSPIAEAVFLNLIEQQNKSEDWDVDSAAIIGYHTGKNPERRALATLKKFGVNNYAHKARVVRKEDFINFDYIFGMDDNNIRDLEEVQEAAGAKAKAKLALLGEYDPQNVKIVPDPYYEDGSAMFEQVYHQCLRCCETFLKQF
ncbi:unnamed protein product [Auanema sp. JU1783]|nr:unnamed protein product [Auanema sp. JU1783]